MKKIDSQHSTVRSSEKVDNDSGHDMQSDKPYKTSKSSEEELEKLIAQKEKIISELRENLKLTQERLQDVIADKKDLENDIKNLELKELSLKLTNFEDLKIKYSKLEHRTQVTKNQLDEARNKIKSQENFVSEAALRVDFMEKVIDDLESRGLADYLRKRFPESFIEYKRK